jgi:hypothetical protein
MKTWRPNPSKTLRACLIVWFAMGVLFPAQRPSVLQTLKLIFQGCFFCQWKLFVIRMAKARDLELFATMLSSPWMVSTPKRIYSQVELR